MVCINADGKDSSLDGGYGNRFIDIDKQKNDIVMHLSL
jgi:hypothetical protein